MASSGLSHTILKNITWNFLGQGCLMLLSFFSAPYIIRGLGIDMFGVYTLISIIFSYIAFFQFGLVPAMVTTIARALAENDHEKIRQVFWACIIAYCVIGVVVIIGGISCSDLIIIHFFKIKPELRLDALYALRIGTVGFLVSILATIMTGVFRATGRFDILNRLMVLFGALQILSTVALLLTGFSLKAIVSSNVLLQCLNLAIGCYYARHLLPSISRPTWSQAAFLGLLKFGGFITIQSITEPILNNVEKIFITSRRSVGSLTYYSVPFTMVSRLSIIPTAVLTVLFPIFSRLSKTTDEQLKRELFFRSTLYMLFIYLFVMAFFFSFGRPFLALWLGNDFARNSGTLLIPLFCAGFIGTAATPSSTLLWGAGKPHLTAIFSLIETAVYVPVSYTVIGRYGAIGAAWTWLGCVTLNSFLLQCAACSTVKIPLSQFYRRLASLLLLPACLCSCLFYYLRHAGLNLLHPLNIAGVAGIAVAYLLSVWRWGMDDISRNAMRQMIRKFLTGHGRNLPQQSAGKGELQ